MNLDRECPECGACAFEIPDPNGDTWCAMCGVMLNIQEFDDDAEEEPCYFENYHKPSVAGRDERPIEYQLSDRVAGASSGNRRRVLEGTEEW